MFNKIEVTHVPIERRNVGMVFQSYALFPNMSVAENIGYGLKIRGLNGAERSTRVAELVALTGIEGLEHRRIDQLSGGQRQRVALARAVAVRPSVLLLDEQLTALDAALRERLRGELNRLLRTLGITTVYVTHDQSEAMVLGDRIVVMRKGAVAQVGTPRDIYFAPASRFVAEFIGAANIVEAAYSGGSLVLPGGKLAASSDNALTKDQVVVMIRPESIRIVGAEGAELCGQVETVSFVGDRQRAAIGGVAAKPIMVDVPNSVLLKPVTGLDWQSIQPLCVCCRRTRCDDAHVDAAGAYRANFGSAYQASWAARVSAGRYCGGAGALHQRTQSIFAASGFRRYFRRSGRCTVQGSVRSSFSAAVAA